MCAQRPFFKLWVPQSLPSTIRGISSRAPILVFGMCATAVLFKQSYFRCRLVDEEAATWDRVERRGYVALPDGRMALVHPRIDARVTIGNMLNTLMEAFSLMP